MPKSQLVNTERTDQENVIDVLGRELHYNYLGNFKDFDNDILREQTLLKFLKDKQGCNDAQAQEAIKRLRRTALCSDKETLRQANQKAYDLLRDGTDVEQGIGLPHKKVNYIDWKHASENVYEIAEEVTVRKVKEDVEHRRPDVVVYVNGIPLAIIELKKASVSVKDAVHQNIRNQQDGEICHFFAFPQLLFAANATEGVLYGTTLTPAAYWLKWKAPTGSPCDKERFPEAKYPNNLERGLLQMLEPSRFLEIIHDLIVFDGGVKKVCRPNQYFCLQAAKKRIQKRNSGIIWHSQGSGKSLMMVWLAQWITENIGNAKIIIITDRDELDKQIKDGFIDARMQPVRAKSGKELLQYLQGDSENIICTLIHKFGIGIRDKSDETVVRTELDKKVAKQRSAAMILQQVADNLPKDFKTKGEVFVFVDECHRTQGGALNKAMKAIVGENVMFIGFTGTPLLQSDKQKQTSIQNFGPYIHTYKFDEAVQDEVILDLRYEARDVSQAITDQESVDKLFESYTKNLKKEAQTTLQQRWANMSNLFSSKERMDRIVANICRDFDLVPCLRDGWGNAMLVAESIYQALRYWKLFQTTTLKGKCACVTSYDETEAALSDIHTSATESENEQKANIAKEMLGNKSAEEYEEWAKYEFINHPGTMKLLIVVDKLLTGFDAPSATYIYLDKKIEDHNLFQAICRVNRLNGEDKLVGNIVDYKDLFNEVKGAIKDYTNGYTKGAFASFDGEDVKGLLKNQIEQGKKDLKDAVEAVDKICENAGDSLDSFKAYFIYKPTTPVEDQEDESEWNKVKREAFYNACRKMVGYYTNIANYLNNDELKEYREIVNQYNNMRTALMTLTGEIINFKEYDARMRKLLDDYVNATSAKKISDLDEFSFLDLIKIEKDETSFDKELEDELGGEKGVAETLQANIRRVINRKQGSNPAEYLRFSERLNRLLEDYKNHKKEYKELLAEISRMTAELKQTSQKDPRLDTAAKVAFYDNFGEDADFALLVYSTVSKNIQPNFRNNEMRLLKVRRAVEKIMVGKGYNMDDVMKIIIAQEEF